MATERSYQRREVVSTDYIANLFDMLEMRSQTRLQNIRERQYQQKVDEFTHVIKRKMEIWLHDKFGELNEKIRLERQQREMEFRR